MNTQLKADLMLLMITAFWGSSYVLTKMGLGTFGPFNLTALRFIIAFGVSVPVFGKNIIGADKKTYKYAFILAVILFAVFMSMTFGLEKTSASNAGFLVSLSVVFIPLISFVVLKQRIEKKVMAGVCLAVIGIALLTLDTRLQANPGDLLCLLCALLFAVHVVATGFFTRNVDSVALGVLQLGFVAVFATAFSLVTEKMSLPGDITSWLVVLVLSILCTAVGYIVQTTAQRHTSATHTGLILSLEPVFSAVFAYFILQEMLAPRGYLGAAILLAGVLTAELGTGKRSAGKKGEDRYGSQGG
ncbi:MAG TPA: DMT family transporter [Bacillota bacterium]|nr:DMT family transporter [Bacillota bacterium]